MIARTNKPTDAPPIWRTADVAAYLEVSQRQAHRWVQALLAHGLQPISDKPFRCFQDNFVDALRAHASERIKRPVISCQ